MKKIDQSVTFILELTKTLAILTRRFDSGLGGLGLNEFTILWNLNISPDKKMRRIDLANKIGLTASGVTRLLLPMEKIGLVKSGESEKDARARYVMIAPSGKRVLGEAVERMELLMDELIPATESHKVEEFSEFISLIAARTYIK